ncbi:MAG: ester cyclase [Dehalococcoidia bacterium]
MTISTGELVHLVIDEIWNRGDLEMADALFTPDYVNHGGLIPDLVRGPEAIKLSVALYRSAFPDFYIAVEGVTTEEAATVIRWVAHSKPPSVDGPTARTGSLRGITRWRLLRGKIAESWIAWDRRAALVRWSAAEPKLTGDRLDGVAHRGSRLATTSKRRKDLP